jgi:16S rRNA (cytosine967-C5)-methyltransferase
MTPGARLQAAIEIIDEINSANEPADSLISGYFKKRRYAGSKDRRAVAERVYGTMRKHARLAWWIERTGSTATITARMRIIADLSLSDKLQASDITDLFNSSRHCPPALDEDELALATALAGRPLSHQTDMPDSVRHEFPQWLECSLKETFGDALNAEMSALNQMAPMDLRINTAKSSVQQVLEKLKQDQIEASPCPWSPIALRVSGNVKMGGVAAYKNGLVEIQDEGSQLLALMCDARPGMNVIDFCAGAGGKTLALAANMTEQGALQGSLTACDIFSRRLARIKPRLERAGAAAVVQKVLVSEDDPWVIENKNTADRVLLDVPCSATGTWRRTPLAKWQLKPVDLEELILTQRRILASASTLVKPGGRLIYATCSILAEENENQIDWFQQQTDDFQVLNGNEIWQQSIGSIAPPTNGPYMRLTPASTQTDGFFCAVLERIK